MQVVMSAVLDVVLPPAAEPLQQQGITSADAANSASSSSPPKARTRTVSQPPLKVTRSGIRKPDTAGGVRQKPPTESMMATLGNKGTGIKSKELKQSASSKGPPTRSASEPACSSAVKASDAAASASAAAADARPQQQPPTAVPPAGAAAAADGGAAGRRGGSSRGKEAELEDAKEAKEAEAAMEAQALDAAASRVQALIRGRSGRSKVGDIRKYGEEMDADEKVRLEEEVEDEETVAHDAAVVAQAHAKLSSALLGQLRDSMLGLVDDGMMDWSAEWDDVLRRHREHNNRREVAIVHARSTAVPEPLPTKVTSVVLAASGADQAGGHFSQAGNTTQGRGGGRGGDDDETPELSSLTEAVHANDDEEAMIDKGFVMNVRGMCDSLTTQAHLAKAKLRRMRRPLAIGGELLDRLELAPRPASAAGRKGAAPDKPAAAAMGGAFAGAPMATAPTVDVESERFGVGDSFSGYGGAPRSPNSARGGESRTPIELSFTAERNKIIMGEQPQRGRERREGEGGDGGEGGGGNASSMRLLRSASVSSVARRAGLGRSASAMTMTPPAWLPRGESRLDWLAPHRMPSYAADAPPPPPIPPPEPEPGRGSAYGRGFLGVQMTPHATPARTPAHRGPGQAQGGAATVGRPAGREAQRLASASHAQLRRPASAGVLAPSRAAAVDGSAAGRQRGQPALISTTAYTGRPGAPRTLAIDADAAKATHNSGLNALEGRVAKQRQTVHAHLTAKATHNNGGTFITQRGPKD